MIYFFINGFFFGKSTRVTSPTNVTLQVYVIPVLIVPPPKITLNVKYKDGRFL